MRYQLVESDSHEGLAAGVEELATAGWTLQGGVAAYAYVERGEGRDGPWSETTVRFVQAMVVT